MDSGYRWPSLKSRYGCLLVHLVARPATTYISGLQNIHVDHETNMTKQIMFVAADVSLLGSRYRNRLLCILLTKLLNNGLYVQTVDMKTEGT